MRESFIAASTRRSSFGDNFQPRLTHKLCRGKLYGRDSELQLLRDVLHKAVQNHTAQLVFVGGSSGTGKTTLIQRAFRENSDCLYGSGKFQERSEAKPYAALINCISELCQNIVHNQTTGNDDNRANYKDILHQQLEEEEIATLVDVVPSIADLVDSIPSQTVEVRRSKGALERLKYALRLFLRAVSLPERPVVLCLDDLHWIDPATLDILQSILSDSELKNLVFVASYRNSEIDDEHILMRCINHLSESPHASSPPLRITVGDLGMESIIQLMRDLLEVEDVHELAGLICNRTNGNIFHTLQLVDYLQDEKLLRYSLRTFRWSWDMDRLRDRTTLSENLVDIVSRKLNRLPHNTKLYLTLCACLGSRVDVTVLDTVKSAVIADETTKNEVAVVDEEKCSSDDNLLAQPYPRLDDVRGCVQPAVDEGLLEPVGDCRLKFTHDRIHQAALQLISTDAERKQLHLNVGLTMWKEYGFDSPAGFRNVDDSGLFVCTDQLNMGRELIDNAAFRVDLARLNCQASKRAASFSAFVPSLEYIDIAIELLGRGLIWKSTYYEFSLDLCTSRAEMAFCAGRIDDCEAAALEVLEHAESIDDSIEAYMVLTQSLSAQANYHAMIDTSLRVLDKLGVRIPRKPTMLYTRSAFASTKRMLKAKSDKDIISLSKMENKRKAAALHVASEMMMIVSNIERCNLSIVLPCRMIHLTFEYGLAQYSALAFALTSQMYLAKNEVDAAFRCARLSVTLLEDRDAARTSSRVCVHAGFALHWREPLSIAVDFWIDAHRRGMKDGDLNAAAQVRSSQLLLTQPQTGTLTDAL